MNLFSDYIIQIFFITDIWIIIYFFLLNFFNNHFPPVIHDNLITIQPNPKPFDIPIYLITSLGFAVILCILYYFKKNIGQKYTSFFKNYICIKKIFIYISSLFLIFWFLTNLGSYPMAQIPSVFEPASFYYILFCFCLIGISTYIDSTNLKVSHKLLFFIFFFFISFSTLNPGFSISGLDYADFLGPITQVKMGGTIYTNFTSLYGFLPILILGWFSRINLFDIGYFPLIIWILYIIQYSICFYITQKISKTFLLPTLILLAILTVNYYSLFHHPIAYPQVGPMRWLPFIISIFALYKIKNVSSKFFIFVISLSSFWLIDIGIELVALYISVNILLLFSRRQTIVNFLKNISIFILFLIFIFLSINVFNVIFGYQLISITGMFQKVIQHNQLGISMIKIWRISYSWLIILLFFSSLVYFLKCKKNDQNAILLLFTTCACLFGSLYYVGRSDPHNLLNISILFFLNMGIFFGVIFGKIKNFKNKLFIALLLFFFIVVIPTYNRPSAIISNITQQYNGWTQSFPKNIIGMFIPGLTNNALRYTQELTLIKKSIPDKKIAIVDPDDTYLLYALSKSSNIKQDMILINPLESIETKDELHYALKLVDKECPKAIVVDCRFYNKCTSFVSFNFDNSNVPYIMDAIQKECKVKYIPAQCTNQMCIAKHI